MFATVRRYTANKGAVRDAAGKVEKSFVPILGSIPGFVSYQLIDAGEENGKDVLVTITTCETHDGVDESVRRAATWVKENMAGFGLSAPMVSTGEVFVTTSAGKVQSSTTRKLDDRQEVARAFGLTSEGRPADA